MKIPIKLKVSSLKSQIYSLIFFSHIALMVVILLLAIRFLTKNLQKSLTLTGYFSQEELPKINLVAYERVAKRLGINSSKPTVPVAEPSTAQQSSDQTSPQTNQSIQSAGPPASPPTPSPTETVTPPTSPTPSPVTPDKKSLTIEVLNSTSTTGLAQDLKESFEQAGFSVLKIGDHPQPLTSTQIQIKDSKKDYLTLIKEAVGQKYQSIETATLAEDSPFDVIIIIGSAP